MSKLKPKPKLLVVDDEQDQSDSIKGYFSRRNFNVLTASSGEEALIIITKNKPDLVLLDLKLSGGIDGKGMLRRLRDNDKKTKVVIITGHILNDQKIKEITDLGIIEFLSKPVDFKTLEKVIRKAIGKDYSQAAHFKVTKPKIDNSITLKRLGHDLSNITNDISSKCELYILDTEEGLYKNKADKTRLTEAIDILKAVLKESERLKEIINKISSLAKNEI